MPNNPSCATKDPGKAISSERRVGDRRRRPDEDGLEEVLDLVHW